MQILSHKSVRLILKGLIINVSELFYLTGHTIFILDYLREKVFSYV